MFAFLNSCYSICNGLFCLEFVIKISSSSACEEKIWKILLCAKCILNT